MRNPEPVSEFQRERAEMLAIYEAPTNLTVPAFAKLAGKSRDQINRGTSTDKFFFLVRLDVNIFQWIGAAQQDEALGYLLIIEE